MRNLLLAAGAAVCVFAALESAPTSAQTQLGNGARCCLSDRGPEAVAFSGRWVGIMARDRCVSQRYGFWDGDPTPNDAQRVCAIQERNPPEIPLDPVPPPGDGGGGGGGLYDPGVRPGAPGGGGR
jgi:hypothetical protein